MDIGSAIGGSIALQLVLTISGLVAVQFLQRRFTGRIVRRIVRSHHYLNKHEEKQREDTLVAIFNTAGAVFIWVIGIVLILSVLRVNVAALLTGAGLIGIVVAVGAQSTVKDYLAGIFIILENQYRVGDVITIGTISGVVESVTIRITKLRDMDGTLHFVPNGQITIVSNQTFGYANVNLDINVSYDSDVKKVQEVINEVGAALARDDEWKASILEPIQFLRVNNFSESGVTLKALGKVMPGSQWDVAGEFRKRLKAAFEDHRIIMLQAQRIIQQAQK